MAKLTESQKIIRRLQSKYSNKEIAEQLGYKSASTVSRIASGKARLPQQRLEQAETILSKERIRKTPPKPSELKKYRKQRRHQQLEQRKKETGGTRKRKVKPDKAWQKSSFSTFLSSIDVPDKDKLSDKLTGKGLTITYFNPIINQFLLSNQDLNIKEFDIQDVNYLLYYFRWEHTDKDGHVDIRNTFPIFPRYAFLGRQQVNSSPELLQYIDEGLEEKVNRDDYGYSVVDITEASNMLAFVHQS